MNQQPGRALTSPVGYNSDVSPNNNNCQQFRLPRNIGMTNSTNTQVSGKNENLISYINYIYLNNKEVKINI